MATSAQDHVDKLQSLIIDLEERRQNLELFDGYDEINYHCDDLIGQVTLTVESAMDHLNKVQDRMIDEINGYRRQLLEAQDLSKSRRDLESRLTSLTTEIEAIKSNRLSHDEALKQAKSLLEKATDLRKQLRADTFGGSFLRFLESDFKSNASFGRLEKTTNDVQDDLVITHYALDKMVSSAQVIDVHPSDRSFLRPDDVNALLFLRDGNLAIATAPFQYAVTSTHSILIWDPKANKKLSTINLEAKGYDFVTALAQLPSGHLVIGWNDGRIKIWDIEHQKHKLDIGNTYKPVLWLRALPNGKLIAAGRDIRVWDLSYLNQTLLEATISLRWPHTHRLAFITPIPLHKEAYKSICFLSKVVNFRTWNVFRLADNFKDHLDADLKMNLRLSMEVLWDGRLAYSRLLPSGPTVTLCDLNEGKVIKEVPFDAKDVESCTILPNGHAVLCHADNKVEIRSLDDKEICQTFHNINGPIVAIRMQNKHSVTFVHLKDPQLPILAKESQLFGSFPETHVTATCLSDDGAAMALGSSHARLVIWPIPN